AVEPYVRRRWPHRLVAWTRLLTGRFRDPLVGRDVLTGLAIGAAWACLVPLSAAASQLVGLPPPGPRIGNLTALSGVAPALGVVLDAQSDVVGWPLVLSVSLLLWRGLIPSRWISRASFVVFAALLSATLSL